MCQTPVSPEGMLGAGEMLSLSLCAQRAVHGSGHTSPEGGGEGPEEKARASSVEEKADG